MTIQQLQDYVNTKPDVRGLINVIVDYIQNNPGGGGGATPTLDEVLAEGSTLTEDRTIDLDGHDLVFNDTGTDTYLSISGSSELIMLHQNVSQIQAGDDAGGVQLDVNSGVTKIFLKSSDNTIAYTADTHNIVGAIQTGGVATLSQDIVISGTGTLTFVNGLLTVFTPE